MKYNFNLKSIATTLGMVLFMFFTTASFVYAGGGGFEGVFKEILIIFDRLAAVLIGLAVLFFLIGVLRYAFSNSDTAKVQARNHIIWGIVALAVMVFLWALTAILGQTFLNGQQGTPEIADRNIQAIQSIEKRGSGGVANVINDVIDIVLAVIPFLVGLGVLFFIWGVFQYIQPSNADKKAEALKYIGWALALLFVMISVWGFVTLIGDSFSVNGGQSAPGAQKVSPQELIVN